MTQTKENKKRMAEFNALFIKLNEKGQESALAVLRTLDFAQSATHLPEVEDQRDLTTKST